MATNLEFLTPVLVLVAWTLVMWVWMYATRIPAMQTARIDPQSAMHHGSWEALIPSQVRRVADNYNHLHEQPTLFYALLIYSHLVGVADLTNVRLAWAYVALRVAHSLVQSTRNFVPLRFAFFASGTIVLMIITARNVLALL
jgi:hypothetical protein